MVLEARVTLGHTGRSVLAPRRLIGLALGLLVAAALVRIALPIVAPDNYAASILQSQLGWIGAFALFTALYLPVLTAARIDGTAG